VQDHRATCRRLREGFDLPLPSRSISPTGLAFTTTQRAEGEQAVLEPSQRALLIDFMGVRSYKPPADEARR